MEKRSVRSQWLSTFTLVALSAGAGANDAVQHTAMNELFAGIAPDEPGCVVAVAQEGKLLFHRAYGMADLERQLPLTTDSIFDVGSLTKQFVAAAVLILIEDGKLALDDDIRKYIPELPVYPHRVTIDHLLTHTGGIRDWTGIARLSSADEDALTMTLRQRGLNFVPGDEWSYSNSGYVLLKEIVGRVSDRSFGTFVHERLFQPLGMNDTRYELNLNADAEHRALAYEKAGGNWNLDVLRDNARGGGGALLTTARDLITWNDALARERLGKFVTRNLHEPATLNNGRVLDYARGLFLEGNDGGNIVWHTGSAGAYKSLLARHPESQVSLAILSNAGEAVERLKAAKGIFRLLVPALQEAEEKESKPTAKASDVDPSQLDLGGKAGIFSAENDADLLRLLVEGDRLRIDDGPALDAVGANHFRSADHALSFLSGAEFDLRFESNDALTIQTRENETFRYQRVRPYQPTDADLQPLAGRYESDEIGATIVLTAGDGTLTGRLAHRPGMAIEFRPVRPGLFARGRLLLSFPVDNAQPVTTFKLSNPVLRNVPFVRSKE